MIPIFLAVAALIGASTGDSISTAGAVDSSRGGLLQAEPATYSDGRSLDTSWVDLSKTPNAPKTIEMKERIGDYFLYWSTLYTMYLANDGIGVIELPSGYTLQSALIGNSTLFKVFQEKNRVTIKKAAFDDVVTTLVLIIGTPAGESQTVAIDVKGGKASTSLARFVIPTNRATNKVVEEVKARYMDQMNSRLMNQEQVLGTSVWEAAMGEQEIFRIPQDLDETEESWKGASFRVDAVSNSRDESFVYMSSDVDNGECQVVDLVEIRDVDGVVRKQVSLFKVQKIGKRTRLIYRTSRLTPGKWKFHVRIWSKEFVIKTILQMGEK